MKNRLRYARQKVRPEVFGLSSLDTVTCALAGSIVLMIIMARATEPGARVELTPYREIFQAGRGNPSLTDGFTALESESGMINPVILYIDYDEKIKRSSLVKATGCNGSVHAKLLRSAAGHFTDDKPDNKIAVAVFRDITNGSPAACQSFGVQIDNNPYACDTTMVSGAHVEFKSYPRCPSLFVFKTRGHVDVFKVEGMEFK